MKKVLFLPEAYDRFMEISEILYEDGYLSFLDSALDYATELAHDIERNLPVKVRKNAPPYFERYGNNLFYSSFPHSKKTVWYVFYSCHYLGEDEIYLVRYIGNNHVLSTKLED